MKEELRISPVKVRLELKRSQQIGMNHWEAHIHGEKRILAQRDVSYYCMDIGDAVLSFKKSEVDRVHIIAEYMNW